MNVHVDPTHVRTSPSIAYRIGERVMPSETGGGSVRYGAVRIDNHGPGVRLGDRHERERVTVRVPVVGADSDRHGDISTCRYVVRDRNRRPVRPAHGDRHRGGVEPTGPIRNGVVEDVNAGEPVAWRVGHAATTRIDYNGSVGWLGDPGDADRIAVDIGVIVENEDCPWGVEDRIVGVVRGIRRIVHRRDCDVYGCRVRIGGAVANSVRETVAAVEVCVWRVRERAVGIQRDEAIGGGR